MMNNIIADYHAYQTRPNYVGYLNKQQTTDAYEYLSRANGGVADVDWAVPKADDQLFTMVLPSWEAANHISQKAQEEYDKPISTQSPAEQQIIQSVNNIIHGNIACFNHFFRSFSIFWFDFL